MPLEKILYRFSILFGAVYFEWDMLILLVPVLICLLAIAVMVLLLLRRWHVAVLIFAITAGLNWLTQTFPLHIVSPMPQRPTGSCSLRVLTYNVNSMGDYLLQNTDSARAMVRFMDEVDADIIVLEEYNERTSPALGDSLAVRYPYRTSNSYRSFDGNSFVYSRYPLHNIEPFVLEADSPEACRLKMLGHEEGVTDTCLACRLSIYGMDVDIRDTTVRLFCCHLMSNRYSVARRTMPEGATWFDGIGDYFRWLQRGYAGRAIEARLLRDSIAVAEGPVLVCGDFNDLSGSYALRTIMDSRLQDAWWNGGLGFGFTYDDYHLLLRLDHILYSDGLSLEGVYLLHPDFSDHYPLVADFILF